VREQENTYKIKVLMYHRVVQELPEKYNHWHHVTVTEFRKQLKLIDRLGYTPITFTDYKLYKEDKLTLPSKPIILTFDDGYMDTFENAIPIMMEKGMKGVVFVMGNRKLTRAEWDERDEEDICPLMTNKQIKITRRLGFEIGSHAMRHVVLSELTDFEANYTIRKSKEEIESILQEPIHSFSYPYGQFDKRIAQIVSDSGYLFACGVYTGSPKFGKTMFDFRRLAINQHTSIQSFALKLITPYQYVEWLYHRFKSFKGNTKNEAPVAEKPISIHRNGDKNYSNRLHEQSS
jgi:peptidoglycan/xylan/chitin deacetylase (PgdA/CDA1 family)